MRTCSKCRKTKPPEAFLKTDGKGNRCKACVNEYTRAWYRANPDKQREYSQRKYLKPGYKTALAAHRKQRRRTVEGNLAERARNFRQRLRQIYRITVEEHAALCAAHDDLCAICRRPETRTRNGRVHPLNIDHDHATGEIRGMLCNACNRGLGLFKDDPQRLRAAADYLEGRLRFKPGPR